MKARALPLLSILLLSGCTVGPNYRKPQVAVPPAYRNAAPEQQGPTASLGDLPWSKVFQDPVLQNLIRTALERNYNLGIAAEQIVAARAQVGVTRANQFPQIGLSGSYTGGQNALAGQTTNTNILGIFANVSYQVDLFGGLRRATEAARAALLATEEAHRTVLITLISDVATNYYQLLLLDLQLQISEDTVRSQENSVRLTQSRVERGVATRVDMLQAKQVLDAANAQIPDLERQIRQTEDAISILLGNYPEGVPRGAALSSQYLPPEVPAGITSALLERRPDIRQAEKNLIYYNARIGVARAAFFPQISLTGSFGRSDLLSSLIENQGIWSYGASLMQPIFTGGALRSNLALAESQQRQAVLSYRQTIQTAFGDVSDALVALEKYREARVKQEQYVSDLSESVRLANMRYNGGITTYLEVLDAQRALFAQQLTLAQFRAFEFQSVVQLYKALGGGWQ